MRYYLIAGEASGDVHASKLLAALKTKDPHLEVRAWGGNLIEAEGATLVKHYKDLAFMGFLEVLMNIRTIARNLRFCKKDILDYKPDALILVDYPGFNLRIADFAHQAGIPIAYYISSEAGFSGGKDPQALLKNHPKASILVIKMICKK